MQHVFPSQFTVRPGLSWSCSILAPWNPSSWQGECQIAKLQKWQEDRAANYFILDNDNLKIDPRWATEEEAADPAFDPE